MTREEAIDILENEKMCVNNETCQREECATCSLVMDKDKILTALDMALSALRPVSREHVEKVFPGCEKCRNQANWPSWIEKGFVYCPKCGTPLTSWAWEKQVERLEALKDGKGD